VVLCQVRDKQLCIRGAVLAVLVVWQTSAHSLPHSYRNSNR